MSTKPHDNYQRLPPVTSPCGRYVTIDAGAYTDVVEGYIATGVSLPPGVSYTQPEQTPHKGKVIGKATQAQGSRRRR